MRIGSLLLARRVVTYMAPTLESLYDEITAAEFPATIDDTSLWLRVFYSAAEAGTHPLEVSIWDSNTNEVLGQTKTEVTLKPRPERGHPSDDLTINLTNVKVPHVGEFEIRVNIGPEASSSIWLTVTEKAKNGS